MPWVMRPIPAAARCAPQASPSAAVNQGRSILLSGAGGGPKTERIKHRGIHPAVRRTGLLSYRKAAGIIPHRPTPAPRLEGRAEHLVPAQPRHAGCDRTINAELADIDLGAIALLPARQLVEVSDQPIGLEPAVA